MKDHPILFGGEMVRAILDGRKTQTRRVIKPQPRLMVDDRHMPGELIPCIYSAKTCGYPCGIEHAVKNGLCPYGKPGDRLWVRECFWMPMGYEEKKYKDKILYRATCRPKMNNIKSRWKPSIHMPRWASRILLEVTGVRVERAQEIAANPEDMLAEGVTAVTEAAEHLAFEFRELWESINAKRGFGWDMNPWVWVVEFKRV